MTSSTTLWYASRATGVVALILLTVVFAAGIGISRQARIPGLPRFAVTDLHRNLSLLAVAFVAVHVISAVLDTFVSIPVLSAVIPFASGYERFWLGLGAISFDLMLAMIITSLVRGRLNRLTWLAIHLTAYLSWPVALLHSIYSSGDLRHGVLLDLSLGCAMIVGAAVIWRLVSVVRRLPRAQRVAAQLAAAQPAAGSPPRRTPRTLPPRTAR